MAAFANNERTATETLNPATPDPPQLPVPGRDSTDEPAADVNLKRKREEDSADQSTHPLWKTSLCSFFRRQSGSCSHGSGCRYAHGEEELRLRPDNTWDPTSERAKKTMKSSEDGHQSEVSGEVMMTEVMDGDDETGLSKCLVHIPRNWRSEQLSSFLSDQASLDFFFFFMLVVFVCF